MSEFSSRLRVTAKAPGVARVSVRRHQFTVGRPLSFDVEYDNVTAVEYALGALGAEIVTGLHEFANRRRLELDAVEAVVDGELGNPLLYFEVVGEAGHPGLSHIAIKVYVASPHDGHTVTQLWNETLARLPLARTLTAHGIVHFTLELTSRV
jgi:hypothetical protein